MPEVPASGRMAPTTLARLALRLLWRDWRGGELRLLLLSLIMAVTTVSGIALFTDRLQQALVRESATMLAADRVLSGREQAPEAWLEQARSLGLDTARFVSFSSMAFSDQGNLLVAAKAVSDAYPLRGTLHVARQAFVDGSPVAGGPEPGEVWVDSRVLPALDIEVGDELYLGEATLTVSRLITREPDRQQGGMLDNAGPRLMLNLEDLAGTNVIQPGSRVSYRYLFAGEQDRLETFSQWLREQSEGRFRLSDVREESREVGEALARAESFLMLGGLFAVLLAGVAIALTARRYSERHFDYAAILKTFGCTSSNIAAIYSLILLSLLTVAVAAGSLLGWLVHEAILWLLGTAIPVELPRGSAAPFLLGAATAMVCLLAFALPPLLALRRTSPLRVLRRDLDERAEGARLPYLLGIAGALILVFWYSRDWLLGSILVASVVAVVLVVALLSWLLLRSGAAVGTRAGSAWRLAMSAARRRRRQSVLQILVFALTLMSLLTLTLLRTDLIDDWQAQLPDDAPNHFLMNMQTEQVDGIRRFFRENGLDPNPFYPMVTAGLISVNGETARDDENDGPASNLAERGAEQARAREQAEADEADAAEEDDEDDGRMSTRQITWTTRLPPDNRIVDGEWWSDSPQPGAVSVDQGYARRMGIDLGDELVFETDGQRFSATVESLRSVRWDNMQPNFFFIFSPGTLDGSGASWLSTITMEDEEKRLLNSLLQQYPTIVVLEVDALIEQIRTIIAQVTAAIELIALLVLGSGALVLLACVNATVDERFRENAILRALGAGKRLILNSLLIEFVFIGLLAGIIATIGAEISLYYLQGEVFLQDFIPHYWAWIAGPVAGTMIIALLGIMATRRVVHTSPLSVLRDFD